MNCVENKTLERVLRLSQLFHSGKIPTLAQHEVHPNHPKGSRENYLYFTLPVCINFQRSSPAMWASALKTYEDKDTQYFFYPEEVVKKGGVTAEEKIRKLKHGGYTKHTYYHCGRSLNYECDEPYITESDLVKQLIANIDKIKFNNAGVSRKIQEDIERYHRLKSQVLHQEFLDGHLGEYDRIPKSTADKNEMTKNYLLHILQVGTAEERQEALSFIKTKFILTNKTIIIQK
jgi:hypothetical protein